MANDVSERPSFFEGMYLGAADLAALLDYLRGLTRRHQLGGHSWGIGAGLELVERETPAGAIEAWITPGWAIDGYGRQIVLLNSCKLAPSLFAGRVGLVMVWLRYVEAGSQGVRPGFEVCGAEDTYGRVAEGFAVEVGDMILAGQQNQGVMLDGTVREEPRAALQAFDATAGLVCDTSLPQQMFMDAGSLPRWLVPIGKVLVPAGGGFQQRDAGQLRDSRLARRPVGVIAETVLGAEGILRLRGRVTAAQANKSTQEVCDAHGLKAGDFDVSGAKPVPIDGIWLEENTRVTGQCKLFGTRLEFRDDQGTDKGVPLYLRRGESLNNPLAGQDLQVILGGSGDGKDRLAIGTAQNFGPITEKVIVRSNGQVGVGTNAPDRAVTVLGLADTFINIKANNGLQQLLLGADGNGAVVSAATNHDLQLKAGGDSTKMWVKASGAIGIGTDSPSRKVTISDAGNCYLNILANGGAQQALLGADGNGAIVSAMTNHDLVLRAGGNSTKMWVKADGRIGIGTSVPDRALTVSGPGGAYVNVRADDGAHEVLVGADGNGGIVSTMTNHDLQLRAGGNSTKMWVKADGKIGIGTSAPDQAVTVSGGGGTYLNVKANNAAQQALIGADNSGAIVSAITNHDLQLRAGGNVARVWVKASGRVGIGTAAPDRAVTVSGPGGAYLNVRSDDGAHEVLIGADGNGGIVSTMTNEDLQLRAGGNATRVWVKASGRLGIGTSAPVQALHVLGNARKTTGGDRWEFVSDARLKTDITTVTGALDRLLQLRGVSFAWKETPDGETSGGAEAGPQLGLIAQEVEPVFPQWVSESEDGHKSLNISGFEAVLIEALRELKQSVDGLAVRLDKLEKARSSSTQHDSAKGTGHGKGVPSKG